MRLTPMLAAAAALGMAASASAAGFTDAGEIDRAVAELEAGYRCKPGQLLP